MLFGDLEKTKQAAESPSRGPLRDVDIICFSHDWTGDPLSKTHIMRVLSENNRILWVNSIANRKPTASKKDFSRIVSKLKRFNDPIAEVEKNIFVMNPLAIPAFGSRLMRGLNRRFLLSQVKRALKRLRFEAPVNMIFNPAAGLLAGKLGESRLIYYCVDEYTAFTGVAPGLKEIEDSLFKKSDLVVVSASKLLRDKKPLNKKTFLIRHGTDWNHFSSALNEDIEIPEDVKDLPRPIIGFHGLLADWVDFEAIKKVAQHFQTGSVVLVGKVAVDAEKKIKVLEGVSNIHLVGRKPYEQLPAYCKSFDVGINPFIINDLTLAANPLKVREYLASGLPVVSSDLPEVRILDNCFTYDSPDGIIEQVEAALIHPASRKEISESIREESWASKVDELRELIAGS